MGEAEEVVPEPGAGIDFDPSEEERPRVLSRDPVCGTDVDPEGASARSVHRGVVYFFCTRTCREEFEADPTRYVG